jgi:hypothetical protein
MKVNKAIYLNFNNAIQDKVFINVNFPVKEIHIKSACLTALTPITAGLELYYTLVSDLTNNEPIAQLYNSSTYSASQFCDISFKPYKPITVNGDYTFSLFEPYGTRPTPASVECVISMILEFNGEGEIEH